MPTLLGIDTGGTFTDAVLLDEAHGILASAKSPTTVEDLTVGIRNALQKVLSDKKHDIHLVSLSSTLATNAVVEGKGHPAGLVLIGYDPAIIDTDDFKRIGPENPVFFIRGGHRISGAEQEPLDTNGLKNALKSEAGPVAAFAVSGYFGVRNPSHELAAKKIISDMTGLPVTCGHELTAGLDAPRRAVTALLNARLIPLIVKMIRSVEKVLHEFDIHAPLMIVKGDGSLISAKAAIDVPIETILSGPAASVVGARYLTGRTDALIIDMGGTTSDIALIRKGSAKISQKSTTIGGFRPMIDSIDLMTEGIGGDSWVDLGKDGNLAIGPRKVVPVCILGKRHPEITGMMKGLIAPVKEPHLPLFILRQGSKTAPKDLPRTCRDLMDQVSTAPLLVPDILANSPYPSITAQSIRYLAKHGMVGASSFTPTDAANVLGLYQTGSAESAHLAAGLIATQFCTDVETLCQITVEKVRYKIASSIANFLLDAEGVSASNSRQLVDSFLIDRALNKKSDHLLGCTLRLSCPIIAVGAPAGTYLPEMARLFGCEISIPQNAGVANAIGAVTGVVAQTVNILIKPFRGGKLFRVHTPEGISDFKRYPDAETFAFETGTRIAMDKARASGAGNIEINISKKNLGVTAGKQNEISEIWVQTEISLTALGRPQMGA